MKVDRTSADGAATRHSDSSDSGTRNERSKNQRTGAHRLYYFVLRDRIGEDSAADARAVLCTAIPEFNLRTHAFEQLSLRLDVSYLRYVLENDLIFSEDGSGMHGSAEFFAPEILIVPSRGFPPRTTNLSMLQVYGRVG